MPWALCPDPGAAADKFCPNATTESQGEPRGSRARYIQSAAGTVNCLYSRKRPIVTTPAMTRQPLGADSRLAALSPSVLPPRAQGTALRAHPCTQHLHHRQHCAVPSLQPTPGPTLSTARPYIHVASKSNHNSIKSNQDDFFLPSPKDFWFQRPSGSSRHRSLSCSAPSSLHARPKPNALHAAASRHQRCPERHRSRRTVSTATHSAAAVQQRPNAVQR